MTEPLKIKIKSGGEAKEAACAESAMIHRLTNTIAGIPCAFDAAISDYTDSLSLTTKRITKAANREAHFHKS